MPQWDLGEKKTDNLKVSKVEQLGKDYGSHTASPQACNGYEWYSTGIFGYAACHGGAYLTWL